MLSVSSAWKAMFEKHIVDEALIKFVFSGGITLYKTDIYHYKFKGRVSLINQEYPYYRAEIETINAYDTSMKGQTCDIYYGFVINGSDEYVKALQMIVYDVKYDYKSRRSIIYLHTKLDELTDTFSVELYEQEQTYNSGYSISTTFLKTFGTFLSSILSSSEYTNTGGYNYNVRYLPAKITKGEAIQQLSFLNAKTLYWGKDNKIKIVANPQYNYFEPYPKINFLENVELSENELPNSVNTKYVAISTSLQMQKQISELAYVDIHQVIVSHIVRYQYIHTYYKNNDLWLLLNIFEQDGENPSTPPSNYYARYTFSNDKVYLEARASSSFYYDVNMYGYVPQNYVSTTANQIDIFDINIVDSTHATYVKNYVKSYTQYREKAEINVRFNPMYELLDMIYFNDDDDPSEPRWLAIEEIDIDFGGSYRARIRGISDIGVASPIIVDSYYESANWYFEIYNPNPFPVKLWVESSAGQFDWNISAKGTITLSDSNAHEALDDAVIEKQHGNLDYNIFAWFEIGSGNNYFTSSSVILLAED